MQQPGMNAAADAEVEFFSIENMQNNEKVFNFCHTFMCIVAGSVAGIVGLTGLSGFFLFALAFLITAVAILFRMRFQLAEYTNQKLHSFLLQGIASHGLSFVLFWTLSYALVHIY